MNGSIQPTVELATNNGNGFYPYPVYPMMGGFGIKLESRSDATCSPFK